MCRACVVGCPWYLCTIFKYPNVHFAVAPVIAVNTPKNRRASPRELPQKTRCSALVWRLRRIKTRAYVIIYFCFLSRSMERGGGGVALSIINHHSNIHHSWPLAEIRRIAVCSDNHQTFQIDKSTSSTDLNTSIFIPNSSRDVNNLILFVFHDAKSSENEDRGLLFHSILLYSSMVCQKC